MKYVHLDDDSTMRVSGDLVCRTERAWQVGLLDCANDPDVGRLHLIEGPGDQYGARFAATRGGSAVVPPPPSPRTCQSLAP